MKSATIFFSNISGVALLFSYVSNWAHLCVCVKEEFLWLKVKSSSVAEISLILEYGNTERVDSNL